VSSERWCCGFQRPPHVPDGELIATNVGPDVRLCRTCWRVWIATDAKVSR
jgi:hypothetical protein